jgi:prolyl oligopeptidase
VVADPYRWLEENESDETKLFVEGQNKASRAYLDQCAATKDFGERMTELYTYEKYGTPFRRSDTAFFFHNTGLQNQFVLKMQDANGGADSDSKLLLDPNTLREDGTAALRCHDVSPDAKYLAYGVSYGGSDWFTIYVRDIATGEDLEGEMIEWCKFSDINWTKDGKGFFYSCYAKPASLEDGEAQSKAGTETDAASNQMLKYHRIGTDAKVVPLLRDLLFITGVQSKTNFLFILAHLIISINLLRIVFVNLGLQPFCPLPPETL